MARIPHDMAAAAKAWPFEEARRLARRVERAPPASGEVVFETGYGPSGLPHIGTFAEVARTTMIRHAFEAMTGMATRLICFSDDMDGLRKVPGNIPDPSAMAPDLGLPLSRVRDPFAAHDSFAANNNARLRAFLDRFGFEYDFASATAYYRAGRFDAALIRALERFDEIMEIMLPTLGPERRQSYSPFLPVSPRTGQVLQVPTLERDTARGTIVYAEPNGERVELPVTGGNVKLQWKPDWAMRWAALGVDYEMSGKDLIDSVTVGRKLCKVLGATPPEGLTYELFLDADGTKISKSKGNGLTMEDWLRYASTASLSYFMFQKPRTAKRLAFDVIPKAMDEYHQQLRAWPDQPADKQLENPVWHVHSGAPPESRMVVSFSMLLNLAGLAGQGGRDTLWGFIRRYAPDATPDTHPDLDAAVGHALAYYEDFVAPARRPRAPTGAEGAALADLAARLRGWDGPAEAEALQSLVYEIGRTHGFDPMRDWFRAIYEVLLGASQGPRFGGFIALYGVGATAALIERALASAPAG